ncbi:MAG: hypothetical protein RIC35_21605 [Marinoscillum sp.]
MKMYQLIWRYECSASQKEAFENAYRRNGTWFQFFEKSEDFLGQELIHNVDMGNYLVIDSWISKETYDSFLKENKVEYDQLDAQCKSLYAKEEFLGPFVTVE